MSEHVLHILGLPRSAARAAIVGDRAALTALAGALDEALASGSGGLELYSSDGEPFHLAVVLQEDMAPLQTSYVGEVDPVRSARELVAIQALPRYALALGKAQAVPGREA